MLVEERSVGRGGGRGGCEEEEEVDDGENPRNDTAPPAEDDRSTSLGAPLEISHSEASPPAAHQTRGPAGGEGGGEASEEEEPESLSHGAAATDSASTLGAPGSLHAETRIRSLASQRDKTPREEPVRIHEEPRGSATMDRMEPSEAGGERTQASRGEREEEDADDDCRGEGELPLPLLLARRRRSHPCTPPRAVE